MITFTTASGSEYRLDTTTKPHRITKVKGRDPFDWVGVVFLLTITPEQIAKGLVRFDELDSVDRPVVGNRHVVASVEGLVITTTECVSVTDAEAN